MICLTAVAQEDGMRPPRGSGGGMNGELPPELKSQLSDSQITQLKAATTMEAKGALLKEWGIKMPERRGGPGGPGGKDKSSSAEKVTSTVEELTAKYKAATTDADKEAVRDQMKALFHQSSSDEVKEKIRSFFVANKPATNWQSPQRERANGGQASATTQ